MIKKLLGLFDKTLLRFLLVGVLNTLVGNGLMFLLYNLIHLGYWPSSAIGYILASIMSYCLNKRFTFRSQESGWKPALRFAANIAVCYCLAYGLAQPLARLALSGQSVAARENVAMLLGMCLFTGLNYLGQRFFAFRQGEEKRPRLQGIGALALSFFLPVAVMFLVFAVCGVWPFGDRQVLAHDMWHQYYPFFVEFHRLLTEGGSLLYSHTSGMGTNFLALYGYYLASPLYLLSALVSDAMLPHLFAGLLLVKIGLCGLSFALFLKITFRRNDWSVVPFSVGFALCAYLMGYYWNIIWLDTVALTPLVMAGTIALLRQGRWRLYVLSLALAVWCNYYIGFFVCVGVALLFLGYTVCRWDGLRGFFRRLGRMLLCSLLAIGLTAVLLLPVYLGLQNTYSAINNFPTGLALNIADENTWLGALDALRQVVGNQLSGVIPTAMSGLPNIFCGISALFLAAVFCFSGKFRLRERICCVLVLLFFSASFIFRQLDYLWHGMHFPNMLPYRFSFLYCFVVLSMAYRAYLALDELKWWHGLAGLAAVAIVIACGFSQAAWWQLALTGVVGVSLFALFLFCRRLPQTYKAFGLLALFLIEGGLCAALGVREAGTSSYSNYPKEGEAVKDVLAARDTSQVDWYRTELTNYQTLNDPALLGYDGVTIFSSTTAKNLTDFLLHLGLASWPASNRFAYMESSPFTNLMLNLRYLVDREGNHLDPDYQQIVAQRGNVTLQENTAYLPMGFVMREDILDYDVTGARAFPMTVQNKLFTMATGVEDKLYTNLLPTEMECEGTSVRADSAPNVYYYNAASLTEDPELSFTYQIDQDTLFCLYFQSKGIQNLRITVNGTYLADRNVKVGSLLCLGKYHAGDQIRVSCTAKAGETGKVNLQAGRFEPEVFDAGFEVLSRSTLAATQASGNTLAGVIEVKDAGLFYTSIPYEPGWTAELDAEPVEITPVGGAFISFCIPQGTHTVTITYTPPGVWTGALITGLSLIGLLLLWLICPRFPVPESVREEEPSASSPEQTLEDAPQCSMPRLQLGEITAMSPTDADIAASDGPPEEIADPAPEEMEQSIPRPEKIDGTILPSVEAGSTILPPEDTSSAVPPLEETEDSVPPLEKTEDSVPPSEE